MKLALERNLDIAVQRLNPSTFDYSIASLQRPTSRRSRRSSAIWRHTNPSTQTISGAAVGTGIEQGTSNFNGGIAQNIRWGGGSFAVDAEQQQADDDQPHGPLQPGLQHQLVGAVHAAAAAQLQDRQHPAAARRHQAEPGHLAKSSCRRSIINTVSNVRNAYWDLVFAAQSVEVARGRWNWPSSSCSDNQTRVEIGTMAPIDVVQAQSQAATQRQNLAVRGRHAPHQRSSRSSGSSSSGTAGPELERRHRSGRSARVRAGADRRRGGGPSARSRSRTDLQQARKNLQVNDITLKYLNNQTLPQADLQARYGLVGQGGDAVHPAAPGRASAASSPARFRAATATRSARCSDATTPPGTCQLNVSYPLGTSAADATSRARACSRTRSRRS